MKTPRPVYTVLSSILILFLLSTTIFPGTTGKISGKVTDAETGEPLIGASIVVDGTYLGAATDVNGFYYINNIPPGKYKLFVSSIGYHKQTVENIIVKIDLTTKLDIKLTPTSVTLSSEVIVRAERPLVQKDLTSSSAIVSSDDIKMMPVESVGQLVNLQAGVVGGHFRGGRSNEVSYLVDGIPVTDAFNNSLAVEIENTSIRQMEVISGTFNAEYGQAMSGVVNIVTQDGSQYYEGAVSAYVGNHFTAHSDLFQNLDKADRIGSKNFQANFSGPIPFVKGLTFFLTGRYFNDDGYLYGKRVYNTTDRAPIPFQDPMDPSKTSYFIINTGDGAYVPMNPYRKYSFNGKLTYSLPNFKFAYSIFWDDNINKYFSWARSWTPDGIKSHYRTNSINTFQITHVISQSTFQTLQFASNLHKYWGHLYADPFDPRYVRPSQGNPITGYTFNSGGNETDRYNRSTQTNLIKYSFTSQISKEHKIGLGAEARFHTLHNRGMSIINLGESLPPDSITGEVPFIIGYPNYGISTDNAYNQGYDKKPLEFSAYIQDKMEYDIMIINAGVRFDYFDPNANLPYDLKNPMHNSLYMKPGEPLWQKASRKLQVSPRLGASFPISDKGAIHFSYGHFFQMPDLERLYVNSDFFVNASSSLSNIMGNPDLKGQKTVSYELGLQQMLFPNVVFDVTVYYRDIRDLLGMEIIKTYNTYRYARYINQDYGNTRGFVVTLEKQFADYIGAKIDYTYQIAEGNSSDPMTVYNNNQTDPPLATNKKVVPLDWDQRSTLNMSMNIGQPGDWTVGLIFRYGSGMPYTEDRVWLNGLLFPNQGIRPSYYNLDLRADKNLNLAGLNFNLFLLVYNVLDIKNQTGVYSSTGVATRDLNTKFASPIAGLNTLEQYLNNPQMYSEPREIRLGLNVGF